MSQSTSSVSEMARRNDHRYRSLYIADLQVWMDEAYFFNECFPDLQGEVDMSMLRSLAFRFLSDYNVLKSMPVIFECFCFYSLLPMTTDIFCSPKIAVIESLCQSSDRNFLFLILVLYVVCSL